MYPHVQDGLAMHVKPEFLILDQLFFFLWFLIVYPPLHGPRPSNSDFPAPAVATVAAPVGTAKALATETKKEQALG